MDTINTTDVTITPSGIQINLNGVNFTNVATKCTGTYANHGHQVNQTITISGCDDPNYNGTWEIDSIPNINTFTFPVTTAPTKSSTGNLLCNTQTTAPVGSPIQLTASAPTFQQGHVNGYWQLGQPNPTGYLSQPLDSNSTSTSIQVLGDWQLNTYGTWTGNLVVNTSTDNKTWTKYTQFHSDANFNTSSTGTFQVPTYVQLVTSNTTSGTYAPTAIFNPLDPMLYGYARITAMTGPPDAAGYYTTCNAVVMSPFPTTGATNVWNPGAFNALNGYPGAIDLYSSRVVFAGTISEPNGIWGSYVSDFQNFKQGAYDSDSFFFLLQTTSGGTIRWMVSKNGALLVGTSLEEWALSASDQTRPITSSNIQAMCQSHYGSLQMRATIVNDTILYIQRGGFKIHEFVYTWASENWISNDITALCEQALRTGVTEIAYQRVLDAIFWFVTGDGQLVSLTYERGQQVVGVARHNTNQANGDIFESVAVLNDPTGEDEVWVIVNRQINGTTQRYIERYPLGSTAALNTGNKSAWNYLDCSTRQTFAQPTQVITNLEYLEGQEVAVWADNGSQSPQVVQNGQITLQGAASNVLVGLPYTSIMQPFSPSTDMQDGSALGRIQKITRLNVNVYMSTGGEISMDGGATWVPMVSRQFTDPMNASPAPISYWEPITLSQNWSYQSLIQIQQTLPVPLTIRGILMVWEATEMIQR
jgi:hypothetical protein